jgi:hypothetical protein
VQVAVDALGADRSQRPGDGIGDAQGDVAIARRQGAGDEVAGQQDLQRLVDVVLDIHLRAMRGGPRSAHRVQPAEGAADVAAVLGVELVERASSHPGERRVVDPLDLAQRAAGAQVGRRHRRHLGLGEVGEEAVLVEDGLPRPATGTVELHDQALFVLQLDLVDPVLERAQGQAAAGTAEPADFHRVEHAVRGEGEERRARLGRHRDRVYPTRGIERAEQG